MTPPVAARKAHEVTSPNGSRSDPYYWLRDDTRQSPEVLAYLNAENAYTDAVLAPTLPLQEKLYGEIVGRIKQDDSTPPVLHRGHWYYTRYETGRQYPVYCRRAGTMQAPEQVLLDGNALGAGKAFFQIGSYDVSPDNRLLAYTEDTVGRRQYTLRFKNLETGETHADAVANVEPDIVWAGDNRTVLYVEKDPVTLLSVRVRRHALGARGADPLVYEEKDHSFYLGVARSKSDQYLFIALQSTLVSEWRYADAADPQLGFRPVLPREAGHEYQVEHLGDDFIVRTNWQAPNFRLMRAPIGSSADKSTWRDVVPHAADVLIEGFEVFRDYLAFNERSGGLRKIRIKPWAGGKGSYVKSDEPAYTATLGANPELDSTTLRYEYTSLTTPVTTYDYDMRTGERTLVKREPVLGDFDPARYATEFVFAAARDGAKVPVSLVYRKDRFRRDGSAPLLQYAYGSYGLSMNPSFSSVRLSLLDRGFVYAIAHIRGGQEMGRAWYENGKLLRKLNTFTDFIDVTEFLVREKYGAKDRMFAMGGSAGGLLMGAIANLRPDLYRGIVTQVPFVDTVTTMLDESIPLTTNEFDEWGNPKEKAYYDYMLAYSPYDNVKAQAYPAMLVETGLWDSQVQYYEPAKWVAKLRATKTDGNPLLFHINMEAGHGGKSGRYEQYRERAREYAFLLAQAGIAE